MTQAHKVWLVFNESSGSNDAESLSGLRDAFASAGVDVVGDTCFPDDEPPGRAELEAKGVDTLAVFSGDGTLSSVTRGIEGWGGAVLALPGGTMNMMSRRMHGDASAPEIVARFNNGIVRRLRPTVIRSRYAVGLTGALAGPGTTWAEVREAMRETAVREFIGAATQAIAKSTTGSKVVCLDAEQGRDEGYAAITLTPHDDGIEGAGYYAASVADFARHGVALLQHDFRNGPHDMLGRFQRVRLSSQSEEPMGLLIDGEPLDGQAEEEFSLGTSDVEFWATADAR